MTHTTEERGTPYRIMSDRTFFDDDLAEGSMKLNPASCVVVFDYPPNYLEDAEILEMAARIKTLQAAIAKATGRERRD